MEKSFSSIHSTIHFDVLEALRGFAAAMVVLYHLTGDWSGYLAVDFFLILSGFILTHATHNSPYPPSKRDFILKRLFRLYPLHIFTLGLVIVVHFIINRTAPVIADENLPTLIQQFTLTNNVGLNHGLDWNYPSWSISVEFWVNMIFIFCIPRTTPTVLLVLLAILPLCLIFVMTGHLNVHYQNYFTVVNAGLLRGLGSFCLGILAYRLYQIGDTSRILDHARRYATLYESFLIVAFLALLIIPAAIKTPYDFFVPPLFFMMVVLFAFESGKISKSLKGFKYLGTLSYSIYLNQIAVIMAVSAFFRAYDISNNNKIMTVMLLLFGVSYLTYHYIEYPCKAYLTRKFIPPREA